MDLFLKDEGVITNALLLFKIQVELQINKKIKELKCDGRGDYEALTPLLNSFGIIKQVSYPHTPQ